MDEFVLLSLELNLRGDPVTGRLHDRQGNATPFEGWIALVTAIDEARTAAMGPASAPAPDRQ
jgi:hypothetical protein